MTEESTYTVEAITKHRIDGAPSNGYYKYELRIKWEGYPESESTWEPMKEQFEDVPDMVIEYFERLGFNFNQHKKNKKYFKLTKVSPSQQEVPAASSTPISQVSFSMNGENKEHVSATSDG